MNQQQQQQQQQQEQEDAFIEFMRSSNDPLRQILLFDGTNQPERSNNNDNNNNNNITTTITGSCYFNLSCLNDVPSVDYFFHSNIGLSATTAHKSQSHISTPHDSFSSSFLSHNNEQLTFGNMNISAVRNEIFSLMKSIADQPIRLIVKGKITDNSNPKMSIVNIEQVFLVSEFDTRLFRIENLQMLGQLNLKATLSASDMEGHQFSNRTVIYQQNESIYAVIVRIDDELNTMSLSTDHSIFEERYHIYNRTDIKFRLGVCKISDIQEVITYDDDKQRRKVLMNRLNDMIEDQPTFRNPYIIQGLVSEKFGIQPFDSLIPSKYTYRNKINVERDNYKQIRCQQNKEFAMKNVIEGVNYDKKNDYERAIQYYDKALQFDPENENAFVGKGASLLKQHKYQEAIIQLEKVLQINPSNKPAISYLETAKASLKAEEDGTTSKAAGGSETNVINNMKVQPASGTQIEEALPVEQSRAKLELNKKEEELAILLMERERKEKQQQRGNKHKDGKHRDGRDGGGVSNNRERRDHKKSSRDSRRDTHKKRNDKRRRDTSPESNGADNDSRHKRRRRNEPSPERRHHREHSPASPKGHISISPTSLPHPPILAASEDKTTQQRKPPSPTLRSATHTQPLPPPPPLDNRQQPPPPPPQSSSSDTHNRRDSYHRTHLDYDDSRNNQSRDNRQHRRRDYTDRTDRRRDEHDHNERNRDYSSSRRDSAMYDEQDRNKSRRDRQDSRREHEDDDKRRRDEVDVRRDNRRRYSPYSDRSSRRDESSSSGYNSGRSSENKRDSRGDRSGRDYRNGGSRDSNDRHHRK